MSRRTARGIRLAGDKAVSAVSLLHLRPEAEIVLTVLHDVIILTNPDREES